MYVGASRQIHLPRCAHNVQNVSNMIEIRKYIEDNHIELPKDVSMEEFIEIVKCHIPFACDAMGGNDYEEESVVILVIMSVKSLLANRYDTRIKH